MSGINERLYFICVPYSEYKQASGISLYTLLLDIFMEHT